MTFVDQLCIFHFVHKFCFCFNPEFYFFLSFFSILFLLFQWLQIATNKTFFLSKIRNLLRRNDKRNGWEKSILKYASNALYKFWFYFISLSRKRWNLVYLTFYCHFVLHTNTNSAVFISFNIMQSQLKKI